MKLSEIATHLKSTLKGQDATFEFVSTDTRTLKPGELFVALIGENFDGHDFIAQAEKNGAVAVVVSHPVNTTLPIIQVANTTLALGSLAAFKRSQVAIPLIALTGSCGKTTVKEMLRRILGACGSVLANPGTLNNDIGAPLTLLKLTPQYQYAVIEMGANHPGEIAYLTKIARPTVAFINNVAPAHLEGFGSIEGVAKAKSEIFQGLAADGTALINADDKFADQIQSIVKGKKILRFGLQNSAVDVTALNIQSTDENRYHFTLRTPAGEIAIQLPLLGQHNILNALAAATAAYAVGAPLSAIKAGLEAMEAVPGRLTTKQGLAQSRILDDTYNANPSSVKAALAVLARYPSPRIFVFGDMGEMGTNAEALHHDIGLFAKQLGIESLHATGNFSRAAVNAFDGGAYHYQTQDELSSAVRNLLKPEITVLVKGARSMKMENVVAKLVEKN